MGVGTETALKEEDDKMIEVCLDLSKDKFESGLYKYSYKYAKSTVEMSLENGSDVSCCGRAMEIVLNSLYRMRNFEEMEKTADEYLDILNKRNLENENVESMLLLKKGLAKSELGDSEYVNYLRSSFDRI